MKTIRIVVCSAALAGFSITALADTYNWVNEKGQKVYSDIAPTGVTYTVKVHAGPSPAMSRSAAPTRSTPQSADYAGDPRMRDTYTADASSAIKERERAQAKDCVDIQQNIARLSSSRNRSIDPETGGSLEERHVREAQDRYNALCRQ